MIVITTPTGDIGSQVLDILLESAATHGEALRVIVRDPAKLPAEVREQVDVVVGSHGDPKIVQAAFEGADAVFWLVPPAVTAPSLEVAYSGFSRPAVQALADRGVGHVVGISALGRGTAVEGEAGLVTASLAMDDLIGESGASYRALACPSFMDNVLRQVPLIRDQGIYVSPATPGRAAPTASTHDIATVAANLLLDRSWSGVGSVPVLGPEDLSPEDMVAIAGDVLGKPVRFVHQSLEDLGTQMAGFGAGEAFVTGRVDMMRAKNEGLDDGVARTPENATPTTFRQWCASTLKPAVLADA